jgi:UDP-N-acetyl-D-mannosaminuronic acid dehydrogenase
VCVLGLGYVGLPTAAVLATVGQRVAGVDLRRDVLDTINAGQIHIVEPQLDALVRAAVAAGTLRAVPRPVPARTYLLCVPTPITADHQPDLSHVESAARAIVPVLQPGALVVLESTVPPGTLRDLVAPIVCANGLVPGRDIFLAHAPERVLPGAVLREVVENERIVGGLTDACTARCAEFYETFARGQVHRCSAEVAELTKLAENAFRDTNVAFANELANVCAHLGLDVWEVIRLANRHPRVQILRPGPGVGGHCIAVDPWFIAASAPDDTPLIQAARRVNDGRPARVVEQVRALAARLRRPKVACSASPTSPTSTTSARARRSTSQRPSPPSPTSSSCSSSPTSTPHRSPTSPWSRSPRPSPRPTSSSSSSPTASSATSARTTSSASWSSTPSAS